MNHSILSVTFDWEGVLVSVGRSVYRIRDSLPRMLLGFICFFAVLQVPINYGAMVVQEPGHDKGWVMVSRRFDIEAAQQRSPTENGSLVPGSVDFSRELVHAHCERCAAFMPLRGDICESIRIVPMLMDVLTVMRNEFRVPRFMGATSVNFRLGTANEPFQLSGRAVVPHRPDVLPAQQNRPAKKMLKAKMSGQGGNGDLLIEPSLESFRKIHLEFQDSIQGVQSIDHMKLWGEYVETAERTLKQILGSTLSPHELEGFEILIKDFLQVRAQARQLFQKSKESVVRSFLEQRRITNSGIKLDPFLGPEQESYYYPDIENIPMLGGKSLQEYPEKFLTQLIPPKYRLAEVLGLGRNKVSSYAEFKDPQLYNAPLQTPHPTILGSVRHFLHGEFILINPSLKLFTFNRFVNSRMEYPVATFHAGPDVRSRFYEIRDFTIVDAYYNSGRNRAWEMGKLYERFELDSIPVGKSERQNSLDESRRMQMLQQMQSELNELQGTINLEYKSALNETGLLMQWQGMRSEICARESAIHLQNPVCLSALHIKALSDIESTSFQSETENSYPGSESFRIQLDLVKLHTLADQAAQPLLHKTGLILQAVISSTSQLNCFHLK